MKILHINCNYLGTALHQNMVEELEKQGVENKVFVPTYSRKNSVIQPNSNVCVSECFNKNDRIIFDYKQKKILQAIEKKYDINDFDIIHAYTLFTDGNVARILSEKYAIPYIVTIRNTDVNDFFKKMIYLRKRGVRNMLEAQRVIFLSKAYKKEVFGKYVSNHQRESIENKTYIIPNGIGDFWFDNREKTSKKINEKTIKIIYAGGIDKNKNVIATQKALELLRKEGYNIQFIVVGKEKDKSIVKKLKEDSNVKIYPPKAKEELLKLYRSADIFVMPSITETFGLVYAEAMSQGLPVVYSKGQGFDGQFEEGKIGFHVSSDSIEDIATAIKKICVEYDRLSANCVSMCEKFKWETIVRKYIHMYKNIVGYENETIT